MISILVRGELDYLIGLPYIPLYRMYTPSLTLPGAKQEPRLHRSVLGQESSKMKQDFGFKAERLKRQERDQEEQTSGYPCEMDIIRTEKKCFASSCGF